jgi:2-polyprenyl-3-methyl-5-hydroxy-6-metoxy-1,4-benzoquinol methylase
MRVVRSGPDLDDDGARYLDDPRTEVAQIVPPGRVLDVGCSRGAFGLELKRLQPSRSVYGIEPTAAVSFARQRLDAVVQGLFPDDVPAAWGRFEVLCFNDVLEHMVDPWTVLANCKSFITPGGCVVASIPNVRYINVVVDLALRGEWKYEPTGVLDQTHLRFFTRASIVDLFQGAGFTLEALIATRLGESRRPTARILRRLGLAQRFEDVLAQRYIVVGRLQD